jgi:hypothetical protein
MKFGFLLISSIIILSCKNTTNPVESKWRDVKFDKSISRNPVFQALYNSPASIFIYQDQFEKDTCGVSYVDEQAKQSLFYPTNYLRCHAYLDSSFLSIDIGRHYLFYGADGFFISYKDKKFYTQSYHWMHNDAGRSLKTTQKIIRQTLMLNKQQYNLGDSIFGKIYFDIVEEYEGLKTQYCKQAIFRAKVKQQVYTRINGQKKIELTH